MIRLFTIVSALILISGCSPDNRNHESSNEKAIENIGQENPKDQADAPKQPNQLNSTGLAYSIDNQILKIFKEGTKVIYERPYQSQVIHHSGGKSSKAKGLYHVYLEISKENDILVVCQEEQTRVLLEVLIPDSVSTYYHDLHSGGIHSRSPSGKFLAFDMGTGSDRQLRIYDLNDQKEIASVNYNTTSTADWDAEDRLVFYGRGKLPDDLLATVGEALVSNAYTTILYEKVWSNGQTSYTGKYMKIVQE